MGTHFSFIAKGYIHPYFWGLKLLFVTIAFWVGLVDPSETPEFTKIHRLISSVARE